MTAFFQFLQKNLQWHYTPPTSLFHFLALAHVFMGKTENPVPLSFFAPKPHGNGCYASYK